jgi:hypothetical protein
MLEEESHNLEPFPVPRDGGVGLDTRKVRRVIVDSPGRLSPRVKAGGGLDGSLWIEEERTDSQLIRPVVWTYH